MVISEKIDLHKLTSDQRYLHLETQQKFRIHTLVAKNVLKQ